MEFAMGSLDEGQLSHPYDVVAEVNVGGFGSRGLEVVAVESGAEVAAFNCFGSVGTLGTFGTAGGCFGTAGTADTLGCGGGDD